MHSHMLMCIFLLLTF